MHFVDNCGVKRGSSSRISYTYNVPSSKMNVTLKCTRNGKVPCRHTVTGCAPA